MPCPTWKFTSPRALRCAFIPVLAVAATLASVQNAGAVSARVRVACASDYFSYCREFAVGTPGVRQCMRAAGPKLSKRCINALVADGEVSQSEVSRREAELR